MSPPAEERSCSFVLLFVDRFVNSFRIDPKSFLCRKYFYLIQWNWKLTTEF